MFTPFAVLAAVLAAHDARGYAAAMVPDFQLRRAGREARIVVAMSGGVDSATVAYLCARAVPPDRLLAVRMPYRTSSEASETDALRVVTALGCRTERVDITLANLSILKTGKARAMRFSTLEAICTALECQPGDILEFEPD